MHNMLDSFYKKECLKKYKYERTYTISYAQRFEWCARLNCVGGVNKVQWSAEYPRQNIGQLLPSSIHTEKGQKIILFWYIL